VRTAFIADVHIGNHSAPQPPHSLVAHTKSPLLNMRAQEVLGVLSAAVGVAQYHKATELVVCGDLFDVPSPSAPFYMAARAAFSTFMGDVVLLAGNHEIASSQATDSPAAVLAKMLPRCRYAPPGQTVDTPRGVRCLGFPALATQSETLAAVKGAAAARGNVYILATHLGVITDGTPPWSRDSAEALSASAFREVLKGWGGVVLGNWHDAESIEGSPWVEQVGALCPTGFDNANDLLNYGQLLVVDHEEGTRSRHFVPAPRFVRVDVPSGAPVPDFAAALVGVLAQKAGRYNLVTNLYVRLRCVAGDQRRVRDEAEKYRPALEALTRGVVLVVDPTMPKDVSVKSVSVTQAEEDDHLFDYVVQADIPTNVPRKRLMKTLKELVKRE